MHLFIKLNIGNPYLEYPVVITIAVLSAYIISSITRRAFKKVLDVASETLQMDSTRFNFIKNAVSFIIYICFTIWVCAVIPPLKHLGDTLFAGAGILAAIVGFASQQAFSNIVSGIFIVIFKPFRVGDSIRIGVDVIGIVEDITLRHVIIKSPENRRIVIPNTVISAQVIVNSSLVDERVYNTIDFTIEHNTHVDVALQILQEEILRHPKFLDGRSEEAVEAGKPLVATQIINITEAGVQIRGFFWTEDSSKATPIKSDLYKAIYDRFVGTGIEFAKSPKILPTK